MTNRIISTLSLATFAAFVLISGCEKKQATSTSSPSARNTQSPTYDATPAGSRTDQQQPGNAAIPSGSRTDTTQMVPDSVQSSIRSTLTSITEDALTAGDLKKVISYFTKADRDRIGDVSKVSTSDLDIQINQFRQNWKTKFNKDFSIKDKELVFGSDVRMTPGIGEGARTAGERMESTPSTTQPSESTSSTDLAKKQVTVTIPGADKQAETTLNFVNEGVIMNAWRLSAPSADAQTLQANLTQQLQKINQDTANWPADANQAARLVSHQVLAAIAGTGSLQQMGQPSGAEIAPSKQQEKQEY